MRKLRSIMILLAFVATSALAQSGSDAPTIEQVEAQIKQAEQALAQKAKQAEAARQAEINRQAQTKRAAAVLEREQRAAKVLAAAAETASAAQQATEAEVTRRDLQPSDDLRVTYAVPPISVSVNLLVAFSAYFALLT